MFVVSTRKIGLLQDLKKLVEVIGIIDEICKKKKIFLLRKFFGVLVIVEFYNYLCVICGRRRLVVFKLLEEV